MYSRIQGAPWTRMVRYSVFIPWIGWSSDELGEIAVTDKADFTLSSDGQLCCLTDLCLLCFAFTSFIFFFFYLGHRHVAGPDAGLGSLTSSLSTHARVYGDTRLRSLPADSGSDRTCLTLERFTVTWEDGYGHAAAHVVKDYTNKAKTDMFLSLSER